MNPTSVYFVFPLRVMTTTHFTRGESYRRVFKARIFHEWNLMLARLWSCGVSPETHADETHKNTEGMEQNRNFWLSCDIKEA